MHNEVWGCAEILPKNGLSLYNTTKNEYVNTHLNIHVKWS